MVLKGISFCDTYKEVGLSIEAGTFEPLLDQVQVEFLFEKMDAALAGLFGKTE